MNFESQIRQTLKKIRISRKEKILVAISGGKDSATTAYLLKKFGYNIEGIHLNLGMGSYSKRCLEASEKLCENLKIKLHVYDIKKEMGSSMCYLREAVQSEKNLKNCAICGVIKKWILNKEARKLKADKLATGHNLDDETETFLMNLLKGSLQLSANTGIITKNIKNAKFVPRIKPLFYLKGAEIKKFTLEKKIPAVYEKCPCAIDSYRIQVREFAKELDKKKKIKLINNLMKITGRMKIKSKELRYCSNCGEPSMNELCKKCEIIKK
jgi:tRNA-5-methyluridine54 2-sulfurtransferase